MKRLSSRSSPANSAEKPPSARPAARTSSALAVAVHRALHLRCAGEDGGDRVRDGAAGVVLRMDAQRRAVVGQDLADDFSDPGRRTPAVGDRTRSGEGKGGSVVV